jgi:phytoene dehydrogenase-like protein
MNRIFVISLCLAGISAGYGFQVATAGPSSIAVRIPPSSQSSLRIFHDHQHEQVSLRGGRRTSTQLYGIFRNPFRRKKKEADDTAEDAAVPVVRLDTIDTTESGLGKKANPKKSRSRHTEEADVCIIGGGVSGLAAAFTASNATAGAGQARIVLLEASAAVGGRVRSDVTDDGFVLDRGFAVFIEEYPWAKELIDYDDLKLGRFQPGALVKIPYTDQLQRVADPLRQPEDLFTALFAQVGSLMDKINLLPLIFAAKSLTLEEIFKEEEIDTLTALKVRYSFSEDILDRFFRPFLEGIYLAPLEEQSSRMFLFVFKMFSEGYASLPEGGIGRVAEQLARNAAENGVVIRTDSPVADIQQTADGDYLVQIADGKSTIRANKVIIAAEGPAAQNLVAKIEGFQSLEQLPVQPQRSVGCLYYSFAGPPPVDQPILILNGIGADRGNAENPANNVCFPSVVAKGYAPEGYHLCSVTVLKPAMDLYRGKEDELDAAVRRQLSTWFPKFKDDILNTWELKRVYDIRNAQPSQLGGPQAANVNRGRDSGRYRGKALPSGAYVCGDHMATATLNGALESGVNAGLSAVGAPK